MLRSLQFLSDSANFLFCGFLLQSDLEEELLQEDWLSGKKVRKQIPAQCHRFVYSDFYSVLENTFPASAAPLHTDRK